MSAKTFDNVALKDLRFRHFHSRFIDRNGDIQKRLVATIATSTMDNGEVAVGVSRCHPGDNPRRDVGRHKSLHRLRRFLALSATGEGLQDQELQERERPKLVQDMNSNLVITLPLPEFMEAFIRHNPFDSFQEMIDIDPSEVVLVDSIDVEEEVESNRRIG